VPLSIPARAAALFALILVAAPAWAQDPVTFKKTVNLVNVLATVRDRHGRLIDNLSQDDFILREDGVPQKIRYFSRETDLPLTIGLLVDTSRSQRGVLSDESEASRLFLDQMLRPDKNQAFVAHFDTQVEILQGLTSSRSDLAAALNRLAVPAQVATLLYSAVEDASDHVMHAQQGRKALIMLTDGVAWKDPQTIENAIASAQRADTILYSIRFSDRASPARPLRAAFVATLKERGKDGLNQMAGQTGGASFGVSKEQTIQDIYRKIEDELRNQYSIGYTPDRPLPDGKFHRIQLIAKDRHLTVETRRGYYSQ